MCGPCTTFLRNVLLRRPMFAVAISTAVIVSPTVLGDEELLGLEVKEAMFSTAIDAQKNYVKPGFKSGEHLKSGPVYLWILLSGTDESLKALKKRRSSLLPLRHKWTYLGQGFNGQYPELPDVNDQDSEALPLGSISHFEALSSEAQTHDQWAWRTWSGKKRFREGWYEVRVILNNGQTLKHNGDPCIYYFEFAP